MKCFELPFCYVFCVTMYDTQQRLKKRLNLVIFLRALRVGDSGIHIYIIQEGLID